MKFSATLTLAFLTAVVKATTDFDALNYALALEYIEQAYFTQGLAAFDANAFTNAGAPYNDQYLYPNIVLIKGHDVSHVTFLQNTIKALGGTPIAACASYNFGTQLNSVANFVGNAWNLKQLAVTAYDGAAGTITYANIQQAAATIVTTEARHADFLARYGNSNWNGPVGTGSSSGTATGGNNPSFDVAATPASIASQIQSLIATCAPTLPVLRTRPSNYGSALTVGTPAVTLSANDVNTLRYAMFLENFENAYYAYYIGTSGNPGTLGAAPGATGNVFTAAELTALRLIGAHEADHVAFLNAALGSNAVAACSSYTFPTYTRAQFLSASTAIENTGVNAYDGALNAITDPAFANAAATIATVEARHADYITTLAAGNNQNHFTSTAFDTAKTPSDVVAVVQSLNMVPASCFTGITLPVQAASNLNGAATSTLNAAVLIAGAVCAAAFC